jgi:hypothetical protein
MIEGMEGSTDGLEGVDTHVTLTDVQVERNPAGHHKACQGLYPLSDCIMYYVRYNYIKLKLNTNKSNEYYQLFYKKNSFHILASIL